MTISCLGFPNKPHSSYLQ